MRYPVAVHRDPGTDFGVSVPDLPGCFSAGSTFDEALDSVREAILCHLEGLFQDKEPLPSPLLIDEHLHNPDYADVLSWAVVEVDISALSGKTKRVNITIPEGILSRIDEVSDNRSAFLAEAAIEKMSRTG